MPGKDIVTQSNALEKAATIASTIPEAQDAEDFADQMTARILSAETEDDVLRAKATDSLGDYDGKVIVVHDLRRKLGGKNKRRGYYLLMDVEDADTGDRTVVSTGSDRVTDQLLWAWSRDKLPWKVKVLVAKTQDDNELHQLVAVDHF